MHADVSRSRESGNLEKERERLYAWVSIVRALCYGFSRESEPSVFVLRRVTVSRALSLARCRLIDGDRMLLLRESKREEREGEIVEAAGREKDTRRA